MRWNSCVKLTNHVQSEKGNVCGMPKQFSYCQMLIDEDNDNGLVLVDFSFRPVDVLSSITCWLLNARRKDKKDKKDKKEGITYEKIFKFDTVVFISDNHHYRNTGSCRWRTET